MKAEIVANSAVMHDQCVAAVDIGAAINKASESHRGAVDFATARPAESL